MDYQEIVAQILKNSQEECKNISANAEKQVADIEATAKARIDEIKSKTTLDSKALRAEILARRMTVADLDVKKLLLNAKQEVIDEVYELAKQKLKNLPTAEYKKLVSAMIEKCAVDGDEVLVGECDSKTITASLVKKIADKKGIKLGYAIDQKIDGGIVLRGKSCDKNMSLDLEIAGIKKMTETEISKRLFNE